jgi:hypothetical protein
MAKKSAFVVYESVWDTLLALPEDKRDEAMWKIIDYGITGKCEKDESLDIALLFIFTGIDTQKRRYRNIQCMNQIIDDVYRRFVDITDTSGLLVAEKTINSLKKIVVNCQKQDLYLLPILYWVMCLLSTPSVKKRLDYNVSIGSEPYHFFTSKMWNNMMNEADKEYKALKNDEKSEISEELEDGGESNGR